MSKRTRIFIGILLIYTASIAFMLYRVVAELDPRYRESAEESLVETSQLLASLIEQDVRDGALDTTRLAPVFKSLYARRFNAQIFSFTKTRVELRAYVTDRSGRVVFDSTGQGVGEDLGTKPSQAQNSRPDLNALASPMVAMAAVAVSNPTPGIWAMRCIWGSSFNEQLALAVQGEGCLLRCGLDTHKLHSRLLHRQPDRSRVSCIGFVATDKGAHYLGVQ